jgi:malonyl CoA-acyl carrier protein transacylase
VFSAVVRTAPEFDPSQVFDRTLFGLSSEEVLELGPVLPHVLEVAYEALELSGLRFDRLRTLRMSTIFAGSSAQLVTARDGALVADILGLPGSATTVLDPSGGLLASVHAATQAIRAGDIDVMLVLGDQPIYDPSEPLALGGVGAVVLGRTTITQDHGRVRALILGSACNRVAEEVSARTIAAARAGQDERGLMAVGSPGGLGLVEAITALDAGEQQSRCAVELGDTHEVVLIVGSAEPPIPVDQAPRILGLSARTSGSLRMLIERTLERLQTENDLNGLASDALCRPHFEHRLALPLRGLEDARAKLTAYLEGDYGRVFSGYAVEAPIAFVVPPAGAQYVGMGDVLYGTEPVFREAMNRCDRALRTVLPRPLLSVLFPAKGREVPVDDPIFANPLTFAFAFALAELYRSRGLIPDAVLGCGVGELAAAAIAGAVDVEEAVRVSAERGRLLVGLNAEAARAVIGASESTVRELIGDLREVDIVALPMPERVVVGGAVAETVIVMDRAREAKLPVERMTGHPNNTPLVEPVLAEFAAACSGLEFQTPEIAWVSATTGRRKEHADASHWASTLRAPMRFSQSVETLFALGCRSFVELAPRPTLLAAGERTLQPEQDQPSWWFASLDAGRDDHNQLEDVLAALWVLGASHIALGPGGRFPGAAELPAYPWDRRPLDEPAEPVHLVAELTGPYGGQTQPEGTDEAWTPELGERLVDPVTIVPPEERPETAEEPRDLLELPAETPLPPPSPDPSLLPEDAPQRTSLLHEGLLHEGLAHESPATPTPAPPPLPEVPEVITEGMERPSHRSRIEELPPLPAIPDAAEVDDIGMEEPTDSPEEVAGDVTLDDLSIPSPIPAPVIDEPTEEHAPDPTTGLLDEQVLEDIEVDAYAPKAPLTLEQAEQAADAEVLWEERWVVDEMPAAVPTDATTWVILADAGGVGDYLATLLESGGSRILRVLQEQPYPRDDGTLFLPDPTEPKSWEVVVEALGSLHGPVRILHLWALDAISEEEVDPSRGWAGVVGLVRELHEQGVPARIHLVTRGALRSTEVASAYSGGSLWGLAAVLACEVPFLFGGIVDLEPDDEDPEALLKHLLGGGTDAVPLVGIQPRHRPEYVFRNGQRWRRVIELVHQLPDVHPIDKDGAWVIAGDVDTTALELAQWFASQGVSRIFLVSHLAPPPEVLRGVLELQRKAVGCIVVRADPTDAKDVIQIRTRLSREPRVGGMVLRIAADPKPVAELDLEEAIPRWRRILAMSDVLGALVQDAQRWVWSEGRSLDGVAGGGLAAISGAAVAARVQVDTAKGGISTVIHTGPVSELSPGQSVRLVTRLGPVGGIHGVWRGR